MDPLVTNWLSVKKKGAVPLPSVRNWVQHDASEKALAMWVGADQTPPVLAA